jgi:hypothetical protein
MRRLNRIRGWDELTSEQRGEVEDSYPGRLSPDSLQAAAMMIHELLNQEDINLDEDYD